MSEINPSAVVQLYIGDPRPDVVPGKSLEYKWDGTRLGVRVQGEAAFQFVDIKGQKGDNLEFKWDGTKLGIRIQGQMTYTFVNLEGPPNEPFRAEMEQMLSSATGSATAAAGSASAANSSKVAAAGSATSAATSASNASGSATSATTSAGAAATSATSAAGSASAAATSATAAQNAQASAESSKSSAAGSASAAATSATSAAGSATVASNAASSANASKETALSAQTAAAGSANAANTYAAAAQNSRSGAENAQASASNYAGFAQASATEAEKSKVAAAGSATSAATSASNASGSATSAATSAGAAASSATAAETARSETAGYRLDVLNLTNFAYVENLYPNSAGGITGKSSDVTIVSNAAIAPDGGAAFKMVEGTTANVEKIIYFNLTKPALQQELTFSVFLKPSGRNLIWFWLVGANYSAFRRYIVDLQTGNITLNTTVGGSEAPVATKASVVPISDGWVRMSFTYTTNKDTVVLGRLDLLNPTTTYTGDGVSGLFYYGPQYSYTKGPIPYLETVGQAMPKTYVRALADSTLGGSNPSTSLPPSQKSVQEFANTKVPIAKTISLSSTNLTLGITDAAKIIPIDSASAVSVTIPSNASAAISIGSEIILTQRGIGPIAISPAAGVNVRSRLNRLRSKSQGDTLVLRKIGTDEWILSGDLAYPLDNLNVHSGWSLRRLLASYNGPVVRVRRASDNVETDVYFDSADQVSGFSPTVAGTNLLEFQGNSTLFIRTLYNQVGSIHFINTTAAQQPQLFLSGSLQNGGAFIRFTMATSRLWAGNVGDYNFLHDGTGCTVAFNVENVSSDSNYRGILSTTANSSVGFDYARNGAINTIILQFKTGSTQQAFTLDVSGNNALCKMFFRHGTALVNNIKITYNRSEKQNTNYTITPNTANSSSALWLGTSTPSNVANFDFIELAIAKTLYSDAEVLLIQ